MRLSELEPRWVGINIPEGSARIGVGFQCPHCKEQRLVVFFRPFIDPNDIVRLALWKLPDAPNPNTGEIRPVHWWDRTGEDFETLTLSPSVDASNSGHWHGFIQNGEVR